MIRAAENLLSPSESNALHKFFSQLDHMPLDALNLSPEWSMYVGNAIHIPEGKSELSKATKDLIALGSQQKHLDPASLHRRDPSLDSTFSSQPAHPSANWPTIVPSGHEFESLANSSRRGHSLEREGFTLEGSSHQGPQGTSSRHSFDASSGFPSSSIQSGSYSTPRTLIPPTPLQIPSQGSSAPLPTNRKRPHDYPFSPADHSGASSSKKPRNVSPATSHNSAPLTQSTPFPFASTSSSHLPNQPSSTSSSSPNILSSSAPHTQSTSHPLNPPPPSSHSQSHSTSHTHQPSSSSSNTQPKQTLLSASQKKANHIQSEQKRRANIRRGYEALCDVVPALREAIRAEEAHCASTGKKRGRGRLLGEDGEKMDGRAGPRSESVVLQKSKKSPISHPANYQLLTGVCFSY